MRPRALTIALLFVLAACAREGRVAPYTITSTPTPTPVGTPEATAEPTAEPTASPSPSPSASPTPTPTATATAAACRNSTNASCGEFRFDPAVGDDAQIDVDVTVSPRNPKVGDRVEFRLEATDEDSPHVFIGTYRFSKDGPGVIADDFAGECPRAYGAWDPPEPDEGSSSRTLSYTYREAGEYEALFTFFSHSYTPDDHPWPDEPPGNADGRCIDPRDSSGRVDVTVRVTEN